MIRNISTKIIILLIVFCSLGLMNPAQAQGIYDKNQEIWRAEVINILSEEEVYQEDFSISQTLQIIEVRVLEGPNKGEIIILENTLIKLEKGNKFFLNSYLDIDGNEIYVIQEPDRRGVLIILSLLFVAVVLIFNGKRGLRALISLVGSFLILFYFFFPRLLNGSPPLATSILFSILLLAFAIYVTHGFNKSANSALLGTIATAIFTIIMAKIVVEAAKLTGLADDSSLYLNISTGGGLDISGILLGAMIIGVLGILDDIAITQSLAVRELCGTGISRKEVYKKAMRIGKEHIGSLINTLALAYAGAAMPLLLLFYHSDMSLLAINNEAFATEIIRVIIGSISVILAVPITTVIALFLENRKQSEKTKK